MKKIFLALVLAMLAYSLVPAHAKPLPIVYIGLWCFDDKEHGQMGRDEECPSEYLKIDRNGYELNASDTYCKFISVKQVGKIYNAPRAEGILGPEVIAIHTVARCTTSPTKKTWIESRKLVQYGAILLNRAK